MIEIDKDKIPKGRSYALKTSLLETVVAEYNIQTRIHLEYHNNPHPLHFFRAEYWLPNKNVEYDRFYITVGTVANSERKNAQEFLVSQILPLFGLWARSILDLPDNSSKLHKAPWFEAIYQKEDITINMVPKPNIANPNE